MSDKKKSKVKEQEPFVLEPLDNNCPKGNHWIVLKIEEISAIAKSGILLPSTAKMNENAAVVVAVAPACMCGLKIGDIVLEPHQSGFPVTIQGGQYRVVSERDITCRYDTSRVQINEKEEKKKS